MLIDDSELDEIEAAYAALRKGGRPPATGWVRRADRLLEYNPYHDEDGRFTTASDNRTGGPVPTSMSHAISLAAPSSGRGRMVVTDDVNLAAAALGRGERVRLRSVRQVSTLVDRLGQLAQEAMAAGKDAPNYDLCRVSVKGTNLFCAESKGIPRAEMPQFKGKPEAGSRADRLAKSPGGEVDGIADYRSHLERLGVGVVEDQEFAQYLKASQRELVGAKVGGMMRAALAGKYDPRKAPIFVSRDNYVVDGHHNWAAVVGLDARDGRLGDERMAVLRIDMDILDVLADANAWATRFGIRPKAAHVKEAVLRAAAAACGCSAPPLPQNAPDGLESALQVVQRLREFDPRQPRWPAGSPDGGQWSPSEAIARRPAFELDGKGGVVLPKNKDGSTRAVAAKAASSLDWKAVTDRMESDATAALAGKIGGISPAQAKRWTQWYETMHRGLQVLAGKYDVGVETAVGIAAVLSQQNAWPANISQTRQLLETMRSDRPIELTEEYAGQLLAASTEAYELQMKNRAKDSTRELPDPPIDLHNYQGQNWVGRTVQASKMTPDLLVRIHPTFPHGSFGFVAGEKAIAIYRGADPRTITSGHKVRSFFNNLLRPDLGREVTIDTHMIRYLFNDPTIQGSDKRADKIFGGKNAYSYVSAMVRETARRTGLKPHQVQALLWNVWKHGHKERTSVGGRAKRSEGFWGEDPAYAFETHGITRTREAVGRLGRAGAGRSGQPAMDGPGAGPGGGRGLGAVPRRRGEAGPDAQGLARRLSAALRRHREGGA